MKTRAWRHLMAALIVGITLLWSNLAMAGNVQRWNDSEQHVPYWGPYSSAPEPFWGSPGSYWGTTPYNGWNRGRPHQQGWGNGSNNGPHSGRYGGRQHEWYPQDQPEGHNFDQHPRWGR
jgi:hypothetical protein